jgi:hypothetical protein
MGGSYGRSAAAAPAAATYKGARGVEMHLKGARSTSNSDRVRELGG